MAVLFFVYIGCIQADKNEFSDQINPLIEKDEKMRNKKYKFSFGAIADCQYCTEPNQGSTHYSLSAGKLEECIQELNTHDLKFVIHLGDFIDRNYASFDKILPIYQSLKMPAYHTLGNHDFDVAEKWKSKVPERMGMQARYYDFVLEGWRFIVLDGNDVSFHAYPKDSLKYSEAEAYYKENKVRSPKWNGAVGEEQLAWMRKILEGAQEKGEKVVLYCHFPVYPADPHNLWNAKQIISILEEFPCVKAYINGHNHKGKYGQKDGIHYLTLKGMVETEINAYSIISVYHDRLIISGHGRETDRTLLIRE